LLAQWQLSRFVNANESIGRRGFAMLQRKLAAYLTDGQGDADVRCRERAGAAELNLQSIQGDARTERLPAAQSFDRQVYHSVDQSFAIRPRKVGAADEQRDRSVPDKPQDLRGDHWIETAELFCGYQGGEMIPKP
jgi:hypothetical protein